MSYFMNDIKKLYRNKFVLFALVLLLLCAIIDPIFMTSRYEVYQNPFMWWIFMNTGIGSTLYNTLYWVIPVLLTGLLFFDERNSAVYGVLITKRNRVSYFVSKIVSVFFVTFISLMCIFLLNLVLVYAFCPMDMPIEEYLVPKTGSFALPLFQKAPLLMAFVYNILHALAMAVLTVLYLCLHMVFKFKNKYIAILVPPLMMHVIDFALQATGYMEYSLTILIQPMAASASNEILGANNLIYVFVGLLAAIMIGFVIGIGRNRDVL